MEILNSHFIESTIREDSGVNGAILVDTILLRESELMYDDTPNLIPADSINDENFIEALAGLLVFKEHPKEMVESGNYNEYAKDSVGTIIKAEKRNINGKPVIYGTLRLAQPKIIDEVSKKHIKGGSLGYYADKVFENGKIVQKHLRPNHFCITHAPRDEGVQLFNSKKGEKQMTRDEVVAIFNECYANLNSAKTETAPIVNSASANQPAVQVEKAELGSFTQAINNLVKAIGSKIFNSDDEAELEKEKGKAEAQEKDIENDKEELEGYKAKIAELEAKNSELEKQLKCIENEADKKDEDEEKNESEAKENEKDSEAKVDNEADDEAQKAEKDEGESGESESKNEEDEKEAETNSVDFKPLNSEVKNSNGIDYNAIGFLF